MPRVRILLSLMVGVVFSSCFLVPPADVQERPDTSGHLRIQLQGSERGSGFVIPDLISQVDPAKYRVTLKRDGFSDLVFSNLTVTALESLGPVEMGTYLLRVEALNSSENPIMASPEVSVTVDPGLTAGVGPLELTGLQTAGSAGSVSLRFNIKGLKLNTLDKITAEWSQTLGGLTADPKAPGLPELTVLTDEGDAGTAGDEFLYGVFEKADAPSGLSYLRLGFWRSGEAFNFFPVVTLDVYDNALTQRVFDLTDQELDAPPVLPGAGSPSFVPAQATGAYLGLQWADNSWIESGYRIYRKKVSDPDFPAVPVADLPPSVQSWEDTDPDLTAQGIPRLVRGETYVYRVVAWTPVYKLDSYVDLTSPPLEPDAGLVILPAAAEPWGFTWDITAVKGGGFTASEASFPLYLGVLNRGYWPLSLESLGFTGEGTEDYSPAVPLVYAYDTATSSLGSPRADQSWPQMLKSGELAALHLEWLPKKSGLKTTVLTLGTDTAASAVVNLTGEADLQTSFRGLPGVWTLLLKGDALTDGVSRGELFWAADRSGAVVKNEGGIWRALPVQPAFSADLTAVTETGLAAARSGTALYSLYDGVSWTSGPPLPAGVVIKGIAGWSGGLAVLDGENRIWNSDGLVWRQQGTAPAGTDRIGAWGGRLHAWTRSSTWLQVWDGRWLSAGTGIPVNTLSVTGSESELMILTGF